MSANVVTGPPMFRAGLALERYTGPGYKIVFAHGVPYVCVLTDGRHGFQLDPAPPARPGERASAAEAYETLHRMYRCQARALPDAAGHPLAKTARYGALGVSEERLWYLIRSLEGMIRAGDVRRQPVDDMNGYCGLLERMAVNCPAPPRRQSQTPWSEDDAERAAFAVDGADLIALRFHNDRV